MTFFLKHILLCFFLLISFSNAALSQTNQPVAQEAEFTDTVIDSVAYITGRLYFDFRKNRIFFLDDNQIFYRNYVLFSDSVMVDLDSNIIFADRNLFVVDVLTRDTIHLDSLIFNLRTDQGVFWNISGFMDNAMYVGDAVKRASPHEYLGSNFFYTTDIDTAPAHFFFTSRIKINTDSKTAIASPVILAITDVPVVAIPFMVYPYERERKSGLLVPTFGGGERMGRYIRNIGYYWVVNDYSDIEFRADFFEGRSIGYGVEARYRHWFWVPQGRILYHEYRALDYFFTQSQIDRRLSVNHRNFFDIQQRYSLSVDGDYNTSRDLGDIHEMDIEERLRRQDTRLNASLHGKLTDNISTNLSAFRRQNFITEIIDWTLPSLSLGGFPRIRYSTIVPLFYSDREFFYMQDELNLTKSPWDRIFLSPGNFNFLRTIRYTNDTLLTEEENRVEKWGYSMPFSISTTPFQAGYINITPSFNFSHVGMSMYKDSVWKDTKRVRRTFLTEDTLQQERFVTLHQDTILRNGQMIVRDSFYVDTNYNRFTTVNSWTSSLNLNTTLYGISELDAPLVKGAKHTVRPTVGYTFAPGVENAYQFDNALTGTIYRQEQQTVSLSVNQNFDFKWQFSDLSPMNYLNLISLNSGINYNFVAEDKKLSMLRNSISSPAFRYLSGNFVIDFYGENDSLPSIENANLHSYGLNFSFPINIAGRIFSGNMENWGQIETSRQKISLNSGLNLSYNAVRVTDGIYRKSTNISSNLSVNADLTETASLAYRSTIDLVNNEIVNHQFDFSKTIRRWRMEMLWVPKGSNSRWEFKVYLIDIPDIRVRRGRVDF